MQGLNFNLVALVLPNKFLSYCGAGCLMISPHSRALSTPSDSARSDDYLKYAESFAGHWFVQRPDALLITVWTN